MGKKIGGRIDWINITPQEIRSLSERMFDAANVPKSSRQDYYRALNNIIIGSSINVYKRFARKN
ncbi:hypothetical protein [Chengkuizengella sediminis]|uniref:hypothetical protein n=1 Tax=Chengkuizengella sediminis TaxID=1885917 RepID=UPI0030B866DD